jgi:hypothetical protein
MGTSGLSIDVLLIVADVVCLCWVRKLVNLVVFTQAKVALEIFPQCFDPLPKSRHRLLASSVVRGIRVDCILQIERNTS